MSKRRKILIDEEKGLHCICKSQDDGSKDMVQCDFCDVWYHAVCINVDIEDVSLADKWFCDSCIEVMKLNPALSRKGLLGFQGRVAPSEGWNEDFLIQEIDEGVILNTVETKRHKTEGYNLFREGRITGLSSNILTNQIFFRAQCQAAMKQKSYIVYMCFKDGGLKLKWATCSCPAGIDGQCKHLVAALYTIIDFHRQGITKIPDVKTCTDQLQMWHVRKPVSDEPLLFSDINFVKHDPLKQTKKDLGSAVKIHNPIPNFAQSISMHKLQKLTQLFDSAGLNLPIINTIKDNNFTPVLPKQQLDSVLQLEMFSNINVSSKTLPPVQTDFKLSDSSVQHFQSAVEVQISDSISIEKNTRMQSKSSYWFQQRQYRITASNFGTFCKLRETTCPIATFQQKRKFFTTKSVRHGIAYEDQAFAKYVLDHDIQASSIGLIVNPSMPHLAATPDRLVKCDGKLKLIEVKCPYTTFQKKVKLSDQMKDKSFYLQQCGDTITLKASHDYTYQIQGQLNIAEIDVCDLVVFVPPDDIVVVEVKRDREFFTTQMLPVLNDVYFNKLLPHFVENLCSIHK